MDTQELNKRLAYLEFVNDQLSAEYSYVDELLKGVGFPEGLKSVKAVAEEMINESVEE